MLLTVMLLGGLGASAQIGPWAVWGGVSASAFGAWRLQSSTPVPGPGAYVLHIAVESPPVIAGGPAIQPLATNAPLWVGDGPGAERATPSAVTCSWSPGSCTITIALAEAHPIPITLRSASGGLQEAINYAAGEGGGTIVVDPPWTGVTADIAAAIGSAAVLIEDVRAGVQSWYTWDGSQYVQQWGIAAAGATAHALATQSEDGLDFASQFSGTTPSERLQSAFTSLGGHSGTVVADPALGGYGQPSAVGFNQTEVALTGTSPASPAGLQISVGCPGERLGAYTAFNVRECTPTSSLGQIEDMGAYFEQDLSGDIAGSEGENVSLYVVQALNDVTQMSPYENQAGFHVEVHGAGSLADSYAETLGAGNGSQVTFSRVLQALPLTPGSTITVTAGASSASGSTTDCSGAIALAGPGVSAGSVSSCSAGDLTITLVAPPASGIPVTVTYTGAGTQRMIGVYSQNYFSDTSSDAYAPAGSYGVLADSPYMINNAGAVCYPAYEGSALCDGASGPAYAYALWGTQPNIAAQRDQNFALGLGSDKNQDPVTIGIFRTGVPVWEFALDNTGSDASPNDTDNLALVGDNSPLGTGAVLYLEHGGAYGGSARPASVYLDSSGAAPVYINAPTPALADLPSYAGGTGGLTVESGGNGGCAPAASGALNFCNGFALVARNAGDTADIPVVGVNGSDQVVADASGTGVLAGNFSSDPGAELIVQSAINNPSDSVLRLSGAGTRNTAPLDFYGGSVWQGRVRGTSGGGLTLVAAGSGGFAFTNQGTSENSLGDWNAAGLALAGSEVLTLGKTTVANLPAAAANPGAMVLVTDSTAIANEGQACAGSGGNKALAVSNGSSWKCF